MVQMTKPTFLAIIPARGGSKGLPHKNIINAAGKPLIAWTIEAALHSKLITRAVVTSDDAEILKTAERYGIETIQRPQELALDTTATEPVLLHAIDLIEAAGEKYNYLVLLQPTSPARNALDVDCAVQMLLDKHASSLISVYEPDHSPFNALRLNEKGSLVGIINNKPPSKRRQDLPKAYMPNGAIYIVNIFEFKKHNFLLTDNCIPFVMPVDKSIDIDTAQDLLHFSNFINARNEKT